MERYIPIAIIAEKIKRQDKELREAHAKIVIDQETIEELDIMEEDIEGVEFSSIGFPKKWRRTLVRKTLDDLRDARLGIVRLEV